MKFDWNERTRENIFSYTVSGMLIVVFWFLFHSWVTVTAFLGKILRALLPFFIGGIMAMLLIPMRQRIEERYLASAGISNSLKHKIAVIVSVFVLILVISSFFIILIPQLIDSARTLIGSLDGYLTSFGKLIQSIHIDEEMSVYLQGLWDTFVSMVRQWANNASKILTTIVSYSFNVISGIFDFFVAFIICIYMLIDQDHFTMQVRKLIYSIFSKEHGDTIYEVIGLSAKMFNSFVYGKALDSLIIGIICAICMSLMKMPYVALISFIIGLTNMIPVFGPFIGAIPCIFILLMISPAKALEFAAFVLVLQQVDGNIIGPRILGDSMGLPALWVMFAILVGGATFGIVGMFLGVPIFSVIYYLVSAKVNKVLREKRLMIK